MNIRKLEHVNVRTAQLDDMVEWYSTVLGLVPGDRPKFSFPGAWMYAGDDPVVHLVGVDGNSGAGSEVDLKLEHFALSAYGREAFEEKLKSMNIPYKMLDVPGFNITQFNIWDPDGNHVHIDFAADE